MSDDPIYQSRSFTKNGKQYWLKDEVWIFDCPEKFKDIPCEYIRDFHTKEAALTALDLHYFHHHPEAHVPLCPPDMKEKVGKWFREFRIRSNSPLGTIREPRSSTFSP